MTLEERAQEIYRCIQLPGVSDEVLLRFIVNEFKRAAKEENPGMIWHLMDGDGPNVPVTQEQYDAIVKERDELKIRLEQTPDMFQATFDLLFALAERLTGTQPQVKLHDAQGNFVWVYPTSGDVRWKHKTSFEAGDRVYLNSDVIGKQPPMTIAGFARDGEDTMAICGWSDAEGQFCCHAFKEACLTKVEIP